MKKIQLFLVIALMASGLSSYSQKLQTTSDTTATGRELGRLKLEIATLSSQLSDAKANLSAYKAGLKNNAAPSEVKQPYESASQSENHALNTLHDKIFLLSYEIDKKQQRLQKINTDGVL